MREAGRVAEAILLVSESCLVPRVFIGVSCAAFAFDALYREGGIEAFAGALRWACYSISIVISIGRRENWPAPAR